VDVTPEDLERAEFDSAADGFDPEGVRELLRKAADKQVEEILATAEKNARERSAQVINEAQQRLDRLLAAERDVHDRLHAAMTDIQASVSRVGVSQSAELALTVEDPNAEVNWADDAADEIAAKRKSA